MYADIEGECMDVSHSAWQHVSVEIGSRILSKQKIIHLRQSFANSSTWLSQI